MHGSIDLFFDPSELGVDPLEREPRILHDRPEYDWFRAIGSYDALVDSASCVSAYVSPKDYDAMPPWEKLHVLGLDGDDAVVRERGLVVLRFPLELLPGTIGTQEGPRFTAQALPNAGKARVAVIRALAYPRRGVVGVPCGVFDQAAEFSPRFRYWAAVTTAPTGGNGAALRLHVRANDLAVAVTAFMSILAGRPQYAKTENNQPFLL